MGAPVICTHKGPGIRLTAIGRTRSALRELRPDIIHTHQVGALFYAGPATRGTGVPLVVHTEHGKHYAAHRRTRLLGWLAGRHAARFFCVSRDIAAEVLEHRVVPRRKVCVVPNGIDTARFAGPPMMGRCDARWASRLGPRSSGPSAASMRSSGRIS